jgi:integrase
MLPERGATSARREAASDSGRSVDRRSKDRVYASSLRPADYDGSLLKIQRAAWRHHIARPKGKRGAGIVPLIPTAATILDEHLAATKVQNFIFETLDGEPGALDYVVREAIRPALAKAGIPWYGLHAFRRGLATNLHELGVADVSLPTL